MKNVNMTKRISEAYVGSVYTNDSNYQEEIQKVRDGVKRMNKILKSDKIKNSWGSQVQYRVSVKGREAIVKNNNRSYNIHGDVVGGIANAKRLDIYIHTR